MKKYIFFITLSLILLFGCNKSQKTNLMNEADWDNIIINISKSSKTVIENNEEVIIIEQNNDIIYYKTLNNETSYYLLNVNGTYYKYIYRYDTWIKHKLNDEIKTDLFDYNLLKQSIYSKDEGCYKLIVDDNQYKIIIKADKSLESITSIGGLKNEMVTDIGTTFVTIPESILKSCVNLGVNQETVDYLENIIENDEDQDDIDYKEIIELMGYPDNEERLLNYILLDYYSSNMQLTILLKDNRVDAVKLVENTDNS